MPAILAILIILAATPVAAQVPSIAAGDWLRLELKARVQADLRKSEAAIRDDDNGGIDVARRRVGVDGRVSHVDFQIEYELAARQWRDVYFDYRQFRAVQLRGGLFKVPFGLEETTSVTNLDFVYRTQTSARLAPGRDRGVSVHGRVLKDVLSYEAGMFANDGDNARPSNSARVFGNRTSAARLVAQPFRRSKSPLAKLQVGGAVSVSEVPTGYPAVRARTVFGGSFFDSDVWVRGRRQRLGLEARWQPYRASIQAEYIRLTDERRGQGVDGADLSPLVAQGWYLSGSYRLTPKGSRYGRVDAAARYEMLSFGSGGAGEPSASARADVVLGNTDRVTTFGVNWQVNRWVKVQANAIHEDIARPSMGPLPGRPGFWSRVFRLQLTL